MVEDINNQSSQRILPAFLMDNIEQALQSFRKIDAHITDQEMVLLINDGEFTKIYDGLRDHLAGQEQIINTRLDDSAIEKVRIHR